MTRPPRGGLGVRKRVEDMMERNHKYRLVGVKPGSIISECLDKYGRWEGGYRLGAIMRNSVTSVTVQWEDEDDLTFYTAGDARYNVDRDRWRITPPRSPNVFDLLGGGALTSTDPDGRIASLLAKGRTTTEEDVMPPARRVGKTHTVKQTAKGPQGVPDELDEDVDIEELDEPSALDEVDDDVPTLDEAADALELEEDDDEELDDVPAPAPAKKTASKRTAKKTAAKDGLPERETYTPKQVAARIGTDAKTLRKFLRSEASTVEAVGQGGRYEFDADAMATIETEFTAWKNNKPVRAPRGTKKATSSRQAPVNAEVIEEDDEVLELDDEEPSDEELEELDEELEELD